MRSFQTPNIGALIIGGIPIHWERVTAQQQKINALVLKLLDWYAKNARDLPWRRTKDPYAIFVSEIMLQQTQVKTVVAYWERWMKELPDIQQLAKAKPARIHKLWEGLGYYTRVRNLQRAAQVIVKSHQGRFPDVYKDVLALPGVGPYTAGSVCSIAFNQPTPILDGNVIRVLTRLFGIGKDPRAKAANRQLWQLAETLVRAARDTAFGNGNGERACSIFNQSLMELGALICTPKRPECGHCPVSSYCIAYREGRVAQLPKRAPRISSIRQRVIAFVVDCDGRFLVRQRADDAVNAHFWEFPNVELIPGRTGLSELAESLFGFEPQTMERLCTIRHSITRYRITLDAYSIAWKAGRKRDRTLGRWMTLSQLDGIPLTSAHRKIIPHLDGKDVPLPKKACHAHGKGCKLSA